MSSLFVRFGARLNAHRAPKRPRAGHNTLQQRRGASPRSRLFQPSFGTRSLLTSVPAGKVPWARRSDLDHPVFCDNFALLRGPATTHSRTCELDRAGFSPRIPRACPRPCYEQARRSGQGTTTHMLPRKGWPLKQGFTNFDKAQQEPNEESVVSPAYTTPRKRPADEFGVVRCAVPPSAASPDAPRFSARSAHVARGVPLPPGFTGTRSRRKEMCPTCHCRGWKRCTVGPENEPCPNCMKGDEHKQSDQMDLLIDNPCYDIRPKRTRKGAGSSPGKASSGAGTSESSPAHAAEPSVPAHSAEPSVQQDEEVSSPEELEAARVGGIIDTWNSVRRYSLHYKPKHKVSLARVLQEHEMDAFRLHFAAYLEHNDDWHRSQQNRDPTFTPGLSSSLVAAAEASELADSISKMRDEMPPVAVSDKSSDNESDVS
ncbi:hypothetical protein WJX84_007931 [Apatococcus fuscideae]|uniref:Uncharacterized protein n=1 Tax=Apatococcus fuscideae TaxID=2026836 RepID=A0AAW1T805_9CHLO